MPTLGLLELPQAWHLIVSLAGIFEDLLNLRMQLGLIAFDRQHVVGALVADRLGCLLLAMHGIQRHDRARQVQQLQELWHRRDFIGVLSNGHLPQADLEVAGPCIEQLQGILAGCRIERVPQRLAVQAYSVIRYRVVERSNPSLKAGIKLGRIEPSEDPAERVV